MRHGLVLNREAAPWHRVEQHQACLAGTQDGARRGSPAEHAGFIERGLPLVGEPPLSRHDNGMVVRARTSARPVAAAGDTAGTPRAPARAAGPTPYGTIHRPGCFPETRTDATEADAGARGTDADAVRHADRLAECGGASHAWRDEVDTWRHKPQGCAPMMPRRLSARRARGGAHPSRRHVMARE